LDRVVTRDIRESANLRAPRKQARYSDRQPAHDEKRAKRHYEGWQSRARHQRAVERTDREGKNERDEQRRYECNVEMLREQRDTTFKCPWKNLKLCVQFLKALYAGEPRKLGDWSVTVNNKNKIVHPRKFSARAELVHRFIAKHNTFAPGTSPLEILQRAVDNAKPRLEVKPRRVGGATYQVPAEVPADRQAALALRWIVDFADARKGQPMKESLAAEILEAYQAQGNAIRKRDEVHKMAQANKAFAHFRW